MNGVKKILLMDDDTELCDEMAEILIDAGYVVNTAYDGYQGTQLVNENNYDVILLDFKMPSLNVVELIRFTKQKYPASKIFLVTARPFVEQFLEEKKVMNLVQDVMGKPFDIDVLLEKIQVAVS